MTRIKTKILIGNFFEEFFSNIIKEESKFYGESYVPIYIPFLYRKRVMYRFYPVLFLENNKVIGYTLFLIYNSLFEGNILRVERPLSLPAAKVGPHVNNQLYRLILEFASKLKIKANIQLTKIEVFQKIDRPVFFPSTRSLVGSFNEPDIVNFLIDEGFDIEREGYIYHIKLSDLKVDEEDISVSNINMLNPIFRKYDRVIGIIIHPKHTFRTLSSIISSIAKHFNVLIFTDKAGKPLGYAKWANNIHEMLKTKPIQILIRDTHETELPLKQARLFSFHLFSEARDLGMEKQFLRAALRWFKEAKYDEVQIGVCYDQAINNAMQKLSVGNRSHTVLLLNTD